MEVERTVICDVCRGKKTVARMGGIEHKCEVCHGVGYRMITVAEPISTAKQIEEYIKAKATQVKRRKKRRKKRTKKRTVNAPQNDTQNILDNVTTKGEHESSQTTDTETV